MFLPTLTPCTDSLTGPRNSLSRASAVEVYWVPLRLSGLLVLVASSQIAQYYISVTSASCVTAIGGGESQGAPTSHSSTAPPRPKTLINPSYCILSSYTLAGETQALPRSLASFKAATPSDASTNADGYIREMLGLSQRTLSTTL